MNDATIKIDLNEEFQHLSKAPIVEAVIDLRARAESEWQENAVSDALKPRLVDYPNRLSMSTFQQEFSFGPGVSPKIAPRFETGWDGIRFETEDRLHIAQFSRAGFKFSRLRPYQRWQELIAESMRLWAIHFEIANPSEVQRMGVRFINRIELPLQAIELNDVLSRHQR